MKPWPGFANAPKGGSCQGLEWLELRFHWLLASCWKSRCATGSYQHAYEMEGAVSKQTGVRTVRVRSRTASDTENSGCQPWDLSPFPMAARRSDPSL